MVLLNVQGFSLRQTKVGDHNSRMELLLAGAKSPVGGGGLGNYIIIIANEGLEIMPAFVTHSCRHATCQVTRFPLAGSLG